MQAPQGYLSAAPYVGSGAQSSMYMGVPPYGSSVLNGTSMPPYDVPFSGGSAYHYNYGSRFSGGSPYRPLHLSGPPPYTGGPIMRNGIFSILIFIWSFVTNYNINISTFLSCLLPIVAIQLTDVVYSRIASSSTVVCCWFISRIFSTFQVGCMVCHQ